MFIFSLIFPAGVFDPSIIIWFFSVPGVASSFSMYFSRCCGFLPIVSAICRKLLIIVLFPSILPFTFGTSNLFVLFVFSGSISLASFSICS